MQEDAETISIAAVEIKALFLKTSAFTEVIRSQPQLCMEIISVRSNFPVKMSEHQAPRLRNGSLIPSCGVCNILSFLVTIVWDSGKEEETIEKTEHNI